MHVCREAAPHRRTVTNETGIKKDGCGVRVRANN